ncbi:RsfA family transcriptional regulator [Cytobacillus pseudoceanisediminis]|uniref:RsfA family transcriptional regulator n=1 Tax=Cytobacillus pseudoceanisediminis TaxID=3051614 RepID=UPI003C2F8916
MIKTRQDSWSTQEDQLLAKGVLKNIREGRTQLQAFEEVGKELSRTSAACGFRWNAYIRKLYRSEIDIAKQQRKETLKNLSPKSDQQHLNNDDSLLENGNSIIEFEQLVDQLKALYEKSLQTQNTEENLAQKHKHLKDHITLLKRQNAELLEKKNNIENEYNALKELLQSAKQLFK